MGEAQPNECSIIRKLNRSKFSNMSYLMPNQYDEILYQSIGLDTLQTTLFFRSKYLENKEHNPIFPFELSNAIGRLFEKYKSLNYSNPLYTNDENGKPVYIEKNTSIPINSLFPASICGTLDGRRIDTNSFHCLIDAWNFFNDQIKLGNETDSTESEQQENQDEILKTRQPKVKWKGAPSHFSYIIGELIDKGYMDKPAGTFNRQATFWLSIFEIATTHGTLAKELSTCSLTVDNIRLFNIPDITLLSSKNKEEKPGK
jgi:hypothetical protein